MQLPLEQDLERALTGEHDLSVVEFTVLDALSRQNGWHMRMQQLARAAALSSSATTRLVTRLEGRGLLQRCICPDDRRGIYTELTAVGSRLLAVSCTVNSMVEPSPRATRGPGRPMTARFTTPSSAPPSSPSLPHSSRH